MKSKMDESCTLLPLLYHFYSIKSYGHFSLFDRPINRIYGDCVSLSLILPSLSIS
jgi:hypothetical protein